MRHVLRLLLMLLLIVSPRLGLAQIHTFPALDTNNNWTGINTFPTGSLNLGNTNFLSSATVTRTFTLPDANSNPVQPSTAPSNQFATGISSAGVISYGQPAFGNLLGSIALSQTPLTTRGDLLVVGTGPALARLPIGAANLYPKSNGTDIVFSTLAAGGVGSCTNQVVTSLNADAAPTCAPVSPAMTTGTTGTGSTFVLSVSPTLTTPNLGDATATSIVVSGSISGATMTTTGNAIIGGSLSAGAISGTSLNGPIGVSPATPNTGSFTTVTASGTAQAASFNIAQDVYLNRQNFGVFGIGTASAPTGIGGSLELFSLTSSNENGLALIHADQYANVCAAVAACPANGCVVDASSQNVNLALGTCDPGLNPKSVKVELGPYSYTIDHWTLRSGLEIAGRGIENVQGTNIQAVGTGNQAPFVMPTGTVSVQGAYIHDFAIAGTAGNTAQDGFNIDVSTLGAGSNFEFSEISRIQFGGFNGSFLHLKGSLSSANQIVQGNIFSQLLGTAPSGDTVQGTNLRMEGAVGQNYFLGNWFQSASGPAGVPMYCGANANTDTEAPYSNWFYGTTIQGAAVGFLLEGCTEARIQDTHSEGDSILFQLKNLSSSARNDGLVIDGGIANGNVGTNGGSGAVVDASDASNTASTGSLVFKNFTVQGQPDKLVKGPTADTFPMRVKDIQYQQPTPVVSTSNTAPNKVSTTTTSLNTGNSHYVDVTSCTGGNITTLVSALAPGERLQIVSQGSPCTFASGGNIVFNNVPSPLSLFNGDTVSLIADDLTGSVFFRVTSVQGPGLKHQRFSGCTTPTGAGSVCGLSPVTWTSAFADANYTVQCNAVVTSGQAYVIITAKIAAGVTVGLVNTGATAASASEFDCTAHHD